MYEAESLQGQNKRLSFSEDIDDEDETTTSFSISESTRKRYPPQLCLAVSHMYATPLQKLMQQCKVREYYMRLRS